MYKVRGDRNRKEGVQGRGDIKTEGKEYIFEKQKRKEKDGK